MTLIVPPLPRSHLFDCLGRGEPQPKIQSLLRPVMATALFFPEYSLLPPVVPAGDLSGISVTIQLA